MTNARTCITRASSFVNSFVIRASTLVTPTIATDLENVEMRARRPPSVFGSPRARGVRIIELPCRRPRPARRMNGSSSLNSRRSPPADDPAPSRAEDASAFGAYGWPFWLAYVNNLCLMTAMSMLYRGYADLVSVLGGDEWELGWILGVGMVGSLLVRAAQGVGIDHYGPRLMWICSTALFAIACW